MATSKSGKVSVQIPEFNFKTFELKVVGDSPLIVHQWSDKAKLEMLNKQTKKATAGKAIRYPSKEFADSLYWLTPKPDLTGLADEAAAQVLADVIPTSKFGFPTIAFKACAIDAGFQQEVLAKKTTARGAFHIADEFAVIEGTPTPREDMVKIGMGTADLRYRGEFKSWRTTLSITFNANVMSLEQIVQLFRLGGFANGVGEWRPARNGSFGTFHVE